MKSFIGLVVKRPITVIMIIISILILGLISLSRLSIDSMPNMQMPYISIRTIYRNAGPEEIEKSITKIVEGAIATVNNIKNITLGHFLRMVKDLDINEKYFLNFSVFFHH